MVGCIIIFPCAVLFLEIQIYYCVPEKMFIITFLPVSFCITLILPFADLVQVKCSFGQWNDVTSFRHVYYRKTSYCDACMPVLCCSEWTRVCDCKLSVTFLPGARPGHTFMTLWIIALYTGCLLPRRTRDCDTCCLLLVQKYTWLWYS
jgi:hypothetical protein